MHPAFQRSLLRMIPARNLLAIVSGYDKHIDKTYQILLIQAGLERHVGKIETREENLYKQIAALAKVQGTEEYLSMYDIRAKTLLKKILLSLHNINNSTLICTTSALNVSCGILITRSPEIIAQEYANAFTEICTALREFYATDSQYNYAMQSMKSFIESKKSSIDQLQEEEALVKLLKKLPGSLYMVTIFCKDPSSYAFSQEQLQTWVNQMKNLSTNKLLINLEETVVITHKSSVTPRT